ncbi:hypothetical protein [Salinicola rhizosphaerae]|uniref:Right-handed parallel beta-helix repeat-containing protein n=1 Tax=Salinicola rhizosphaerae TaxID=1443141 RepID=A0ABQ3DNY3_9GAMM|nr:hypothetical protein [Salinicola rhizosphaerae]GHB09823.1 hypothetical protein GCM10009038_04330 [Salinicola rhizosphaerae]
MEVKTFFAQSGDGSVIPHADVSVFRHGEETPADDLADAAGKPMPNPFQAGAQGQIQFAAPNGHYWLEVASAHSRQRLDTQFFDQAAVSSASGTQSLTRALDQRLIVVDSVDTLRGWDGDQVPDGSFLICRRFYRDRPFELNVELQRTIALDDQQRAGTMAWLPAHNPLDPHFHHFTLWGDDGAAYVHPNHEVNLLKVGFRADYRDGRGTDESARLQETLDKTPYRTKYLPDLPNGEGLYVGDHRVSLRSGTRLIGDGPQANSRLISDYAATSFRDGLLWLREDHVIEAWKNGRPEGDVNAAFSRDIEISGLTFEASDFASAAVAMVCVRDVFYQRNHHHRCGGIKFFHELELNDRYSLEHEDDPETDNAVMAGFNPETPDDLNQNLFISELTGGAPRYSVRRGEGSLASAVRLNFVRDFSITHVQMAYCNLSGWGGSARAGKGGELRWMRRLRDGYISDVHCNRSNGAIYFNNAHNVKVFGCSAREVSDTAFDLEGCTYCLFDGIYCVDAGNFAMSVFYATRGNVFRNFHATQTGTAARLRQRYGTKRFSPGLGKTMFRRLAGFEDPDFDQDVRLETGSFVYEGDGFGAVIVDTWADVTYRDVRHENVMMDLRGHSNAQSQSITDCHFLFTRPANEDDVLVAIGTNRELYGSWRGGSIVSTVTQPTGVVPLLAQLRAYAGTAIYDIENLRIDVPGADTAMVLADARQSGRSPAHAFRLHGNLIPAGSRLLNANVNELSGGAPLQVELVNNRHLDFSPVEKMHIAEESDRQFASLAFGIKASR